MAGYTLTNFNQLTTALSTRLNNSGFWTQSELQGYLVEALRTWQVLSASYSTKVSFPTQPNVPLYNLSQIVPKLSPTVTDQDIVKQLQAHLQEPVSATSWLGTEQFNYATVVQAITKRRDKFLIETGLGLSISEVSGPTSPSDSIELDDTVIDVRRALWKTPLGVYSLLWRLDQFTLSAAAPTWMQSPGLPTDYTTVLEQPLIMQVVPPPIDTGMVALLTTNSGTPLNPSATPTPLGIPDDLSWVVKFGALADLFSQEGPGQDLRRAQYCESRWKDGITLARITNFVRLGYQDGVPAFVDSMEELDQASPSWMSSLPGTPNVMAVSGNIAAISPIPDNSPHSIGFNIMPKFPIPSAGGDFIQIGNEIIDVILDYSQHLAYIKEGADEILASMQLYKNLVSLAAVQNDRLRAQAQNFDILSDRTHREEKVTIRRKSDLNLKELDYES